MHELHQVPSGWLQKGVDEAGRQVVKEVNSLIHESRIPIKKGGGFCGFIPIPKMLQHNLNLSWCPLPFCLNRNIAVFFLNLHSLPKFNGCNLKMEPWKLGHSGFGKPSFFRWTTLNFWEGNLLETIYIYIYHISFSTVPWRWFSIFQPLPNPGVW